MIKVFELPEAMKPKYCDACNLHDADLIVQENIPGGSMAFVCRTCFNEIVKPDEEEEVTKPA